MPADCAKGSAIPGAIDILGDGYTSRPSEEGTCGPLDHEGDSRSRRLRCPGPPAPAGTLFLHGVLEVRDLQSDVCDTVCLESA